MKVKELIKRFKTNRSFRQYLMVALICMVVIGGSALTAFILTTNHIRSSYQAKLTSAQQQILDSQKNVYETTKDILPGQIISKDNTKYTTVLSSQDQKTFIDITDIGKTALIKIPAKTAVTKSEVTNAKVSSDLRETNFTVISNSANVVDNDTVDVRIVFPNGENYIVLSKKNIFDISKDRTECYFWLDEEEIQLMSSAIVDAYLYDGAKIYTTEYIEPSIQDASVVTYVPSDATIKLIKNDPNIVNIASKYLNGALRKDMESKLTKDTSKVPSVSGAADAGNNQIEDNKDVSDSDTLEQSESNTDVTDDNVKTTQNSKVTDTYFYDEDKSRKGDLG